METIGLVLGGGASKGSWQAGALLALIERNKTFPWNYIVGVSVGALNGAMVAVGKDPSDIWKNMETDKVYRKYNKLRVAWRILRKTDSAYSTKPLQDLLRDQLLGETVQTRLIFVATNIFTGNLVTIEWPVGHILQEEDLNLLRASASMPILFDPVVRTQEKLVDGGVRQINPIGTALKENPDHLCIILCGPTTMEETHDLKGVFDIAGRTIDIFMNEIFNSDLEQFFTINNLVMQARQQGYFLNKGSKELKWFSSEIIAPTNHLGDGMDFSSGLMQKRIDMGYENQS